MPSVTTWLRVADPDGATEALASAGLEVLPAVADEPLVVVLDDEIAPADVAAVLADWIAAARDAAKREADVVTILSDDHLDGDDVGRVSVGHGVIAASRAYGFEGQRRGRTANVVVGPLADAVGTARFLLDEQRLNGQVLLVGDAHHGRQRP